MRTEDLPEVVMHIGHDKRRGFVSQVKGVCFKLVGYVKP